MTDETNTATQTAPPEIDLVGALAASQEAVLDLQAQNAVLNDQRIAAEQAFAEVKAQLDAAPSVQVSDADKLTAAYALVDADKAAKKAAYDEAQAAAHAEHEAELAFIRSCTPQQVSMAGLVIGPLTTHRMIYDRLKAVVGNG